MVLELTPEQSNSSQESAVEDSSAQFVVEASKLVETTVPDTKPELSSAKVAQLLEQHNETLEYYAELFKALADKLNSLDNRVANVAGRLTLELPLVNITGDPQFMPSYANATDACLDLRAFIKRLTAISYEWEGQTYKASKSEVWVMPGETVKLSSGLKACIPEGYEMNVYARSSTAIKKGLMLVNSVAKIDAGYRDEIFMCLYNCSSEPVKISNGDRVCQFEIKPRITIIPRQVADSAEFRAGDRGGGIGSTGDK